MADPNANQKPEKQAPDENPAVLDPNDADRLKNQIRGQTLEHATPPRLEDEGQSGG